ncbi:hypothetical protein A3G16_03385 [Candidatus Curtissbacteria bacterium RIFCSPLOWO2_12_FULL_41_16]|nr:MAG: hypothetical protein A3G16_03385 [Candidatus Curtissbacteria bacterium RIFCSPLOWO2_12_FULL_41_16]
MTYSMSKSDFLFLAVLATLPIQLNKFFWPSHSFVLGLPIDYRAITVYLSDLAIFAYLAIFVLENWRSLPKIYKDAKTIIWILALFNLYLFFTSFLISYQPFPALWFTLKIFEFSLTSIAASVTFSKKNLHGVIRHVITFSVLWQSALVIWQFVFQRTLGLWILGERTFDSSTTAIAHAQILGHQLLRPYGTFPHPNVAAAFFVISAIILSSLKLSKRITRVQIFSLLVPVVATLLTFSKSAILAIVLAGLIMRGSAKNLLFGLVFLAIIAVGSLKSVSDFQLATIAERLMLSQASLDITKVNPLFGVGSGNFILELSKLNLFSLAEIRLLQPVHNVFLLILAENGIIGLLLFVSFLLVIARQITTKPKVAIFIVILVFASLDHFLWTLQQGQLLFWLSAGYILSNQKN